MEKEATITLVLSNGKLVTIPLKNWKDTLMKMEEGLKNPTKHKFLQDLLQK